MNIINFIMNELCYNLYKYNWYIYYISINLLFETKLQNQVESLYRYIYSGV